MRRDTLKHRRTAQVLRKARERAEPIRDPRATQTEPTKPYDSESILERGRRTANHRAASMHRATRSLFGDEEV